MYCSIEYEKIDLITEQLFGRVKQKRKTRRNKGNMRNLILMLLLAFASNSAMAGWITVSESNSNGGYTSYADPTTIRKNGNSVKMWILGDFKTAHATSDGKTWLSEKIQNEYDCKEDKTRALAITLFSGNMGEGDLVISGASPKWEPNAPDSVGEILWKYACGKK